MKKALPTFLLCLLFTSLFAQWRSIRPKQAYQNLRCLSFVSDSVGYIGGEGHRLYFTDDFATNLQPINLPFSNGKVTAIHATSANTAYVLLSDLDFVHGNNHIGFEKYLLKTTDGGQSWQQSLINQNSVQDLLCMAVLGTDTVFTAGDNGMVFRTFNAGVSWDSLSINMPTRSIHTIHAKIGGEVIIGGDSGIVYRSTDYGASWNAAHQMTLGMQTGQPVLDFFSLSPDTLYACGRGRSILRSDDGGMNWQEINNENQTTEFSAVHFKDTLNGVALGGVYNQIASSGGFYTTTDGGRNWNRRSMSWIPGENKKLSDLHVVGNDILAVGELGRVLKSTDYGVSRNVPNEVPGLPLTTDIEVLSNNLYVMSCRQAGNTMARSTDSGRTWSSQRNSFSQTPMFIANNGNGLLLSTQNDKILRSYDQGVSWSETTNSTVNRTNKGYFLDAATFVGIKNQSSDLVYSTDTLNTVSIINGPSNRTIYKLDAVNLNTWFVVDDFYDLYRTVDAGASWELMNSSSLNDFSFTDSLNGWGTADNSNMRYDGLQKTTDGGRTWTQHMTNTQFDIYEFDKHEAVGDVIVATCAYPLSQAVLISTDAGVNWTVNHDLLPYGDPSAIEINQFGTWIYSDIIDFVIENRAITSNTSSVSIEEFVEKKVDFQLYPNPTKDELNIRVDLEMLGLPLTIYNLSGKEVLSKNLSTNQVSLNLDLAPGLYLVRVGQSTQKLVVR
ncbi:MAG: YCF48-related protein [Vicingaceae bacterium]